VYALDFKIAVIQRINEMRSRARRFAARDRSIVENNDEPAFLREQISGRKAGYTCSHYANIRGDVFGQSRPDRYFYRHPNRSSVSGALHD
jgi:hypothetical protein